MIQTDKLEENKGLMVLDKKESVKGWKVSIQNLEDVLMHETSVYVASINVNV